MLNLCVKHKLVSDISADAQSQAQNSCHAINVLLESVQDQHHRAILTLTPMMLLPNIANAFMLPHNATIRRNSAFQDAICCMYCPNKTGILVVIASHI